MKKHAAFLLTVFNRKEKTLICLNNLMSSIAQFSSKDITFSIFLTDDGSTDGTYEAIRIQFPEVTIIKGTGNLYWNQGMRLAWSEASKVYEFDYYFWLNNDTFISNSAISHLFECYYEYLLKTNIESIVVGACSENTMHLEFSYGLCLGEKEIHPNGNIQSGDTMNGNFVLIPRKIFKALGNLSPHYTHAMGDFDYGFRAIESGFHIITTKKYVAVCESNEGIPNWKNPKNSLNNRWQSLHSPTGLNINEYKIFRKRFWKEDYYLSIIKIYLRCLFPSIINRLKK